MARFIGKLLGEYSLGISDSWYALRIDKMIEENILIVIENKDPSLFLFSVFTRRMAF